MAAASWTVEQDNFVKALLVKGYSSTEISSQLWRKLGVYRNRNAVIGRIHRQGFESANGGFKGTPTYWTSARLDELGTLYHAPLGYTRQQMADKMGILIDQLAIGIGKLRRRDGIVGKKPGGTAQFRKTRTRAAPDPFKRVNLVDLRPSQSNTPVSFLNLASHHCRWPLWEGAGTIGTMLFCGATAAEIALPYCAQHCRRAYRA